MQGGGRKCTTFNALGFSEAAVPPCLPCDSSCSAVGPNQGPFPPTVANVSLSNDVGRATITGVITSDGGARITEVGFCWTHVPAPPATVADDSIRHPSAGYPPQFSVVRWSGDEDTLFGRLFAVNAAGLVGYAPQISYTPIICLAKGTLVAVRQRASSGDAVSPAAITTKPIEDVRYSDDVVVWDFDEGRLATAKPLWIKVSQTVSSYNVLTFTDGTELRTVNQHRLFNADAGKFTNTMCSDTPVGTRTFTLADAAALDEGRRDVPAHTTALHAGRVVDEPVEFFNIITTRHMNLFANGILTSCRYNNLYPVDVDAMRFVKQPTPEPQRRLPDLLQDLPTKFVEGMRLAEQPWDAATLVPQDALWYVNRLLHVQARTVLFLDHQGVMRTAPHPSPGLLAPFDPAAVSRLNALLAADATMDIVVSSDWREWVSLQTMRDFYVAQGVVRAPVAYTPLLPWADVHGNHIPVVQRRAQEIRKWLEDNRGAHFVHWLVLDDLDLAPHLPCPDAHFVHIDASKGLAHDDSAAALAAYC